MGHNHYGKGQPTGYYGVDTPGYSTSKGFEDAYGLYKGKDLKAEGTVPQRKWWTKLEKDQANGMSARKEYDAIGQELMASGDYSPKQIARILLAREQEKQARGV
jgi:hypothetical protein